MLERLTAPGDEHHAPPATLIAVAHPDDESVGAGARLRYLREAFFLCATDGAPRNLIDARNAGFSTRDDYAAARRAELLAALSRAGVPTGHLINGGIADQEATVRLPLLVDRILQLLEQIRPEVVLTHPYEGGHPDHDSVAFAVHAACRLFAERSEFPDPVLSTASEVGRSIASYQDCGRKEAAFDRDRERRRSPVIVEMASYHMGSGGMVTGTFLPDGSCPVVTRILSEEEQQFKHRLLDCYRTQRAMLNQFPLQTECFRGAPQYDFTEPPHPGRLFYEHFDWGMTGERWRRSADELLERLQLRGPL